MLQALGRNRIIVLALLALMCGGLGYALYQYLIPSREKAEQVLSGARSELEKKRAEIQKLKEEYALLQSQLRYFKELEAKGFFNNQGRVEAQEAFEKLRTVSGILNAKYNISAGQLIDDVRATDAGYVILNSPINVELDSLDDVDVYSFLKLIQERFPGKVDIVKMSINKADELSIENLRSIGTGNPIPLIKSQVGFQWRTMASRESVTPESAGESQSETPASAAPASATPSVPTQAPAEAAPAPAPVQGAPQ